MKEKIMIGDKTLEELLDQFIETAQAEEHKFWHLKTIAQWIASYDLKSIGKLHTWYEQIEMYLNDSGFYKKAYPEGFGFKIELKYNVFKAGINNLFKRDARKIDITGIELIGLFERKGLSLSELTVKNYLRKMEREGKCLLSISGIQRYECIETRLFTIDRLK